MFSNSRPKVSNKVSNKNSNYKAKAMEMYKGSNKIIVALVGFIVLLKAKRSDALWISFACWLSYIMFSFTSSFVDAPIAVFLSSVLLGFASNLFAKIKKRNSAIMLVPGMILLVPGSLGFFSISNLLQSNIVEGIEIALKMLTTSMALVMGIIVSDVLLESGND